jgi:hypothetical protein
MNTGPDLECRQQVDEGAPAESPYGQVTADGPGRVLRRRGVRAAKRVDRAALERQRRQKGARCRHRHVEHVVGQRAQTGLHAVDHEQADPPAGLVRQPVPDVGAQLIVCDELALRIGGKACRRVSVDDQRPQQPRHDRFSGAGVAHLRRP